MKNVKFNQIHVTVMFLHYIKDLTNQILRKGVKVDLIFLPYESYLVMVW